MIFVASGTFMMASNVHGPNGASAHLPTVGPLKHGGLTVNLRALARISA